jgi:hypothetical protein
MMKLNMNLVRKKKDLIFMGVIVLGLLVMMVISNPEPRTDIPKPETGSDIYVKTPYTEESTETPLTEEEMPPADGDYYYSQGIREMYRKYPWYSRIPIDTPEYTVVYDFKMEQFRIRLKMSSTAPQAEKDRLVAKALNDIKSIGYAAPEIPHYVLFTD